jgi:hypothetical protein
MRTTLGLLSRIAIVMLLLAIAVRSEADTDLVGIRKIVVLLRDGKEKEAAAAAKEYRKKNPDLDDVMIAFKKASKGGILEQGVEATVIRVSKQAPDAKAVAALTDDLGLVPAAIALIVEDWQEKKPPPEWFPRYARKLGRESRKLAEAIRAKDPAAIKTAAERVNATCVQCHTAVRAAGVGVNPKDDE